MGKKSDKLAAEIAALKQAQQQPRIDYSTLAANLLRGVGQTAITTKAVGSTPTATYGHGPAGLFSSPGLSAPLLSAMILPNMGLQSVLPVRPSRDANPLFGIVTGVNATTGSEASMGVCDDPPVAGVAKLCTHTFVFGRQSRMSPVIDLSRVGLWTNRGEFGDLQLMNNPFRSDVQTPTIPGMDTANMARNEMSKTLFEFATAWARDFAKELYTGNPTNNSTGGGRKYFYGLDVLINTGYRDAETGAACAAADSLVRSFGSLDISARDSNGNFTNGTTLVRTITNMYRNLRFLATRSQLEPVEWVLAMPWSMFYEITEVWPIAYSTYRNTVSGTNQTLYNDARYVTEQRDAMRGDIYNRTGQYLLIDGVKVPCILDDSITETVLAGESFTATLYFIPMTVLGGTPVTLLDYLPFDQPGGALEAARLWAPGNSYYVTDNGRFFWHLKPPTNFCVQFVSLAQPRLLLLTPYLAARLTSIKYTPLAHERSGFTDSSYFVDGGRTTGSGIGPSYYSPTS